MSRPREYLDRVTKARVMKVEALVITSPDRNGQANATAGVTTRRLQQLLRFGSLMLSAGETAFRVRRSMGMIASGLGFEWLSVQLGARNLVASGCRDGEIVNVGARRRDPIREHGAHGALEALARTVPLGYELSRVRGETSDDRKCAVTLFDRSDIYGCRRFVWRLCFA